MIEKKEGVTTIFNIVEYPPAADTCVVIYPDQNDYDRAFTIAIKLRDIGKPIDAIDILTASMCLNRNFRLLTKDSDFLRVKEVEKEFDFHLIK